MTRFELNSDWYETDEETLQVLRSVVPAAKATSDPSAVIAMIELGLISGRIRKVDDE